MTWTAEQLATIAAAGEIDIAPRRPDDRLGPATTIWIVRVGDDLYVRSYRGPAGRWYRNAVRTHEGRIHPGDFERDVTFDEHHSADSAAVDAAYRAKYGNSSYVDAMVTPDAAATTLRVLPLQRKEP
jgi:hypothetical protein